MKLDKLSGRGAEHLYRHPSSAIIYFRRYTTKTGEAYKSLRTKDLNEAKAIRDKMLGAKNQKAARTKQKKTALELYDESIERAHTLNKSPGTITSMKASRHFFELFLGDMMPDEVTADWWEKVFIPQTKFIRWKAFKDGDGNWQRKQMPNKKQRTFANDCKWIMAMLNRCVRDGLLDEVPEIINPDPEREPGKVYTDEEIGTLLGMAQNEDLALAIEMGATMGMRRGEIFALQADRVDIKASVIRLRAEDTKTRKKRSFAISPSTLERIVARARAGRWIFPSKADSSKPLHKDGYMTAWKNLKKMTGISGRFHFLRHTFLTKAFRTPGSNPALICFYAGLSLEVAQKVYLHFGDDDTRQVAGLVSYAA